MPMSPLLGAARSPRLRRLGFTLIEVLLALVLLSLLTLLSWRGLSGVTEVSQHTAANEHELQTLTTLLAQWQTDLDLISTTVPIPLEFDGRTLYITRRSNDGGVQVVVWMLASPDIHGERWLMRLVSQPLLQRRDWLSARAAGAAWATSSQPEKVAGSVKLLAVRDWQILYFRGNAWVHPLSSTGSANAPTAAAAVGPVAPAAARAGSAIEQMLDAGTLPDGIRLHLALSGAEKTSDIKQEIRFDWVSPLLTP